MCFHLGKWTYFLHTLPNVSDFFQSLESIIIQEFIPAVTGRFVSDLERDLFALPVWMGGLGLCNPSTIADFEYTSSVSVTSSLIHEIIQQRMCFSATVFSAQHQAKTDVVSSRNQRWVSEVSRLTPLLPNNLHRLVQLSGEKGASS